MVERKTRFVIRSSSIVKQSIRGTDCSAERAAAPPKRRWKTSRQMKRLPAALRRSMTYDRGSEIACHPELARRLKIDIWFYDPHAPWQRGSNENTNGLLRQFFPKGTDLSGISQTQQNDVARLMNQRPAKPSGGNPRGSRDRGNRSLQMKRCT